MSKTKTGGIKFDRNNYRTHDESNKRMIRESLEACGAGRSVLVDNQNELIAGNGVFEQAQKLGIPTRIIETDGTELVVVKRTDLEPEDKKRKQLAAADNAIADKVTWNAPAIRADFTPVEIQALNIDLPPVEIEEEEPTDLDADAKQKPFVAKIVFDSADALQRFMRNYDSLLRDEFNCTISISGGEL